MIIISLSVIMMESPNAVAMLEMWQRTWRGIGLTRFGDVSCLIKHQY